MDEKQFLSIKEAGYLFGFGRTFMYAIFKMGAPSLKVGKRRIIPVDEFTKWLVKNHKEGSWTKNKEKA